MIGLILSSPLESKETEANQPQSAATSPEKLNRIAAALEKLPKEEAKDTGCQPGQDDRGSDLCAQWKAADAASDAAIWAARTFWAGLVGILIGAGTLFAAWRAAHWAKKAADHTATGATEAKRAADAAHQANEITERESQPFIYVSDATFTKTGEKEGRIVFSIENVGKSPGVEVFFTANISGFMPEGQFHEERMRVGRHDAPLALPKENRERLGAVGTTKVSVTRKYENNGGIQNAIIASGFVLYDTIERRTYYSRFFFFLSEHEWEMGTPVPMQAGGLEIDIFEPYDGPDLRERDGY